MFYPCTISPNQTGICVPAEQCTNNKNNEKAKECKSISSNTTYICCLTTQKPDKAVLNSECGHQNIVLRSRIVGGRTAVLGEFPWMARLIHVDSGGSKMFGCAGFLINPKTVLTAGHCLKSENIDILGPM